MDNGSRIKTLGNALAVLMEIPSDRGISITELSGSVALTKSSICKILSTFRDFGFVSQDPVTKTYRLGPTLIQKGHQALQHLDIRRLAIDELRRLRDMFHESTMLMIPERNQAIVIELCEADKPIRMAMHLGQSYPLHRGAAPKLLLAYRPEEQIRAVVENLNFEKLTDTTITSAEKLYERLEKIRTEGYSFSPGEIEASGSAIAVPIFDVNEKVVASIAMCAPKTRMSSIEVRKQMTDEMIKSGRRVSYLLGAMLQ